MADTIFVNDDGIKASLDSVTGKSPQAMGAGALRLFTAPTTVSKNNVVTDFTEATFTGYSAVLLNVATWAVATASAHVASSTYGAAVTFTRTVSGAAQTIYGWFLTDAGKTKVYACALFASGPFTVTNNGDSISVTPTLTEQSLN